MRARSSVQGRIHRQRLLTRDISANSCCVRLDSKKRPSSLPRSFTYVYSSDPLADLNKATNSARRHCSPNPPLVHLVSLSLLLSTAGHCWSRLSRRHTLQDSAAVSSISFLPFLSILILSLRHFSFTRRAPSPRAPPSTEPATRYWPSHPSTALPFPCSATRLATVHAFATADLPRRLLWGSPDFLPGWSNLGVATSGYCSHLPLRR